MHTVRLVDTHVHWDRLPEDKLDSMVDRARKAGVVGAVAVGTDAASCTDLLQMKRRYSDFLQIALGYHPEQKVNWGEVNGVLQQIRARRNQICAVGEVGLPWYTLSPTERTAPPNPEHKGVLERFLQIAVELDVPVILHAVHDSAEAVFRLLQAHSVRQAVFHWLKAPEQVVDEIVGAGYMISVTPEVCYRKRDRELVKRIPLSSLLLETDAPWPHGGAFRNRPAEPAWVERTAEAVSQVKGISLLQVAKQTTANAERLFNRSF